MDTQPSPSPPVGGRRPQAHVLADYSGRGAAAVADELRRIGLRPGVQRVDAATAEEVGAILAQDPPAGADAARNSVITLYVGAAAPRDPALSEPPTDRLSPETATRGAPSRRRRKPGHVHALNATPATPGGVVHAERDAEPMTAAIHQDGEGGAERPGPLEAREDGLAGPGDLAAAGQRVHHDTPPPTPVEVAGAASALDARTLLTPLSGLPRPFTLKRWQRITRRSRLAITSGLACVAALLTLALTNHHPQSAQHAASASRQAARPTLRRPTDGARSSSRRRHQQSRTPTASPTRPASRTAAAPSPRPHAPAPAPEPSPPVTSPTVMSPTVTSPVPPAVPAPVAPADQAAEPSVPAVSGPVAVDGQVPGGPFSP